jgi:ion channel
MSNKLQRFVESPRGHNSADAKNSRSYTEAIYHSAVNFASLGYGDFVMSKNRKLLGPLEAVNGVIMLGMTSAALMVILQQLIRAQRDEIIASTCRSITPR